GQDGARAVRPPGTADVIGGAVELTLVPAVQDQAGPVGGEPAGQGPAEAVGGAGDEDRRPVGHAGSRPGQVRRRRRRRVVIGQPAPMPAVCSARQARPKSSRLAGAKTTLVAVPVISSRKAMTKMTAAMIASIPCLQGGTNAG